jgi:hypothetical protein
MAQSFLNVLIATSAFDPGPQLPGSFHRHQLISSAPIVIRGIIRSAADRMETCALVE